MLLKKVKELRDGLIFSENEKYFLEYIKKSPVKSSTSDELVMVEFSPVYSNIIGLYFFLTELRKVTDAKIVSYFIRPKKIWSGLFVHKFKKIYELLGISHFVYCYPDNSFDEQIKSYIDRHQPLDLTEVEIERLKINDVWVGDLIYDTYLFRTKSPTLILGSLDLKKSLEEGLYYYFFWSDFFEKNKVKKLIVSHTVYAHIAIAARVAVKAGIEVFQVNDSGLYRLSEDRLFAYHDFFDFKKIFNSLPQKIQAEGLCWAEERLRRRFHGEVGVDMHYSKKSAWTASDPCPYIKKTSKIKIFVALHCFFDSPHPYGLNLFPDFWKWLSFLGDISNRTDYDWYLKTHPDFLPGNQKVVDELLVKYPKFNLLPSNVSHHSIINSGIDFVLTVYGTVGMEYAYFKVPVINASKNNIHCAFNFNLHPQTIQEYESMLLNLQHVEIDIRREEILQYYFIKNKICSSSWIWDSQEDMLKAIGGGPGQRTGEVLKYFFKVIDKAREDRAKKIANKFILSNSYNLTIANED